MSLTQRSKRKILSILIILMMTVTMLPSMAFAASPSDISKHWAKAQIEDFMAKGLVNGYPDGSFKPDNNITRAEFMVMVNKAFGYSEKASIDYKDVAASAWYADAVAKAKAAGYIAGYTNNTVKPNNPISRQEAAIVIMKAQKLGQNQTAPDKFTDASSIPAWSKGAIGAAVTAGIMTGYPDGTFKASNSIKRAEAVVALGKALAHTTPVIPDDHSVIYDKAGTYGPATGTATVTGNVTIKAQDITLQNTVIEGNLMIDKAVGEGNATFKNVVVKGNTYVYGGGTNSVYFIDTQTGKTYVLKDSGPVRIVVSGTSEVSQLIAQSSVKVEEVNLTGKGFDGIIADRQVDGTITVNLAGIDVENIKINSTKTIIVTDKNTHISSFVTNAAVKVTGAGTISNATINASGVTYDTKFTSQTVAAGVSAPVQTPSSGGGGSSGGSSVGLVSAIIVTGEAMVGATLTAAPTPSGATGTYQWQSADAADGTYANIASATLSTYVIDGVYAGKFIKVTFTASGSYSGIQTSTAKGAVLTADAALLGAAETAVAALEVEAAKDLTVEGNLTAAEALVVPAQTAVTAAVGITGIDAITTRLTTAVGTVTAARTAFDAAAADNVAIAAAKNALETAATLNPVQGTHTSVVTMAQAIVDEVPAAAGVTVTVSDAAGNTKVAENGTITYSGTAFTGNVIFALNRGTGTPATATMSVVVPENKQIAAMQGLTVTGLGVADTIGADNNGKVNVTWTALTAGDITDSGAQDYEIYYLDSAALGDSSLTRATGGATKVTVAYATTSSTTISGLIAGTEYKFVIYAVSAANNSLVSNTVTGTPLDFIPGTHAKIIGTVSILNDAALEGLTSAHNGKSISFYWYGGSSTWPILNSIKRKEYFLADLKNRLGTNFTIIFNEDDKLEVTKTNVWDNNDKFIRLSNFESLYLTANAFFGSDRKEIDRIDDQN